MSLKKQAISGLLWTFTQQFSVRGINVIVGVILARILMPSAFGLIGMLAVFVAIGNSLMDSGMTSSLIRTHGANQEDYSTVFFVNLLFSIVLYVVIYFCAPLIASFYDQEILKSIVRIYTLSFIIRAFVGVQTTKLTKEMRFKLQMFMQIPSVIVGGCVGIVMAYKGYGVWSLVWMNLVQSFLFAAQHWIFAGWAPSPIIDKAKLKYHFHFGYKLTLSGLIDTIYSNAYRIIIGKYFSATELGYYTQAQTLQMLPVNNISIALNKVTYPMFAAIKDDDLKLKNAYQKLLHQVIFWVAPLMVLAILIAKPLFLLLLTTKWLPAVPYFQILCITGILYPFHTYNLNILNVKGRSELFLFLELIKKGVITVGIAISIFYGIFGLLIFQVIFSVFAFWINTYYSGRLINYPAFEQIKEVLPTILISFGTGLLLWFFSQFVLIPLFLTNFVMLIVLVVLYILIYLLLAKLFKVAALNDFKQLILKR